MASPSLSQIRLATGDPFKFFSIYLAVIRQAGIISLAHTVARAGSVFS
jgi:hypothetical protein